MPEQGSVLARARAALAHLDGNESLAVVSPHFDDGVFGCGELLAHHAGSALFTVFGGIPDDARMSTEWDRRCGFASAREAVEARRSEDFDAASVLSARPRWFEHVDDQYAGAVAIEDIAHDLARHVDSGRTILVPLGLFHADHVRVALATEMLLRDGRWRECVAYEDALYRIRPGLVQRRLAHLHDGGLIATPLEPRLDATERKRQAVLRYTSQLRAFGQDGYGAAMLRERYWLLHAEPET